MKRACVRGVLLAGQVVAGSAVLLVASTANAQWTVTNLHPAGASESNAVGVSGGQQVGYAIVSNTRRGYLWTGTAASAVDLTPTGGGESGSEAYGVSDGYQVGYARFGGELSIRARMWSGEANAWADLHPFSASYSIAYGALGGQQVGLASIAGAERASLWTGTSGSRVDLHPQGAAYSFAYATSGAQQVGLARMESGSHAILWAGTLAS
ncbi:MAG: hypothetical protein AABZ53_00375, partial [Planctomycetota bacterium]